MNDSEKLLRDFNAFHVRSLIANQLRGQLIVVPDEAGGTAPPASPLPGIVDEQMAANADRRYSDRVAAWLTEFHITACQGCADRLGHVRQHAPSTAYAAVREEIINCSKAGRTASTLLVWAHEVSHIVLHRLDPRRKPSYLKEYEATILATRLLRRDGIAVPWRSLDGLRRYVAHKVLRRARRGLPIRRDVVLWCHFEAQEIKRADCADSRSSSSASVLSAASSLPRTRIAFPSCFESLERS